MNGLNFNLVRHPWIPVVVAGKITEVSLSDALLEADKIDGLVLSRATETVAVIRQVLIPVVMDALPVPRTNEEWAKRWSHGFDKALLSDYLDRYLDRFELFSGPRPFAQVAGLQAHNGEAKSATFLVAAGAMGNNSQLFRNRSDEDPPLLTPAEAARALLAAHCWDTAGIKTGAVGDSEARGGKAYGSHTGPLGNLGVVVLLGRNLAETLMLNTPVLRQGLAAVDYPQWRSDQPATPPWSARAPRGLLDLLTWQSRRIRLIPDVDPGGNTVIRRAVLTAGDRITVLPEFEPHTAWKEVEKATAQEGAIRPVRHVSGRAGWRGLEPLLATRPTEGSKNSSSRLIQQLDRLVTDNILPDDLPIRVFTVGVHYGTKSAVVEDVSADVTPLPIAALDPNNEIRQLIDDIVGQAEQLRRVVNRLAENLRIAQGVDEKQPWDRGQHPGDILMYQLTPVVRRILGGLQRAADRVDEAEDAWRKAASEIVFHVAAPMLLAAPPTAFLGRTDDKAKDPRRKDDYRLSVIEARFRHSVRAVLGIEPLKSSQPDSNSRSAHV